MEFDFTPPQRILFGRGKASACGEFAVGFGKRALLVRGGSTDLKIVTESMETAGVKWQEVRISAEPDIERVCQAVEAGREFGCQLVIGCGGGSVIDTAKAVGALLANPGEIMDYLEVVGKNQPLRNPSLPVIALPTTAGTGSEATRNAVMMVPEQRVKVSLRSPSMLPRVAIIDPELTLSLPADITASTGLDALAQVFEPYVSRKANQMTDQFCRGGLEKVGKALPAAVERGDDIGARTEMAWVSLMGGMALANAGLGAVHGFAAPLGGMYSAPHGAVCGRLLPAVTAVNIRALREREPQNPVLGRYDEAAAWLTGQSHASADDAIRWLEDLVEHLHVPRLREYGLEESGFEELVEKALQSSSMKGNPIDLTREECKEILAVSR